MLVSDFAWNSRGVFDKPGMPIVYQLHIQHPPASGAFGIMVTATITDAGGETMSRQFACSVEVTEDENKPGWQDAMKALLVRECLARWEA